MNSDLSLAPELGHIALIFGFCLTVVMSVVPMWGAANGNQRWMALSRPLAVGQFVFLAISFICLTKAFLDDDFSVSYVAANSNTLLPDHYKISAVWGAHEGSLLLWALIQGGWTLAVALLSRSLPMVMVARVLAVMGMINVGFLLFMLLTSNPFERILPAFPGEGNDLNPLLQDFGLIVHPPTLYMGYVGFSVAFSFAIAALIGGKLDTAWARWTRPWTNVAWSFLTVGIALGSWWAYYELGWGGWWFWDAVENASFMPWLAGTGLIHSLAVAEKRGLFRSWTLLLAILAFSLSLLGTFLVRSGILTSVHAFALDSERGVFILGFLAVVIGGSLLLYALRGGALRGVASFGWVSREMFLLFNNVLLMLALAIVFIGTLYPLLYEWMGWGRISVGPPWFNLFFVPVFCALTILIPVGAVLRWKRHELEGLTKMLRWPVIVALLAGVLLPLLHNGDYSVLAAFAIAVGVWVLAISLQDLWRKSTHRESRWQGLRRLRGSYYGMVLAHVGVAISLVGVALNSVYSVQKDVRLEPGQSTYVGHYEFRFEELKEVEGPNYRGYMAVMGVYVDQRKQATLLPEKRNYLARDQWMTEAGIDPGFTRDLYVSMGEALEGGSGNAWAMRIYHKAYVRWIWLGALLTALGALLAALDKRYRKVKVKQSEMLGAAHV